MSNNILDLPEKELLIKPYKPESWHQDRGLLQGEQHHGHVGVPDVAQRVRRAARRCENA